MIGVLFPYAIRAYVRWAVALLTMLGESVPNFPRLRSLVVAAGWPKKHRAVIARFGRHPHRNTVLGRASTPEEAEYLARSVFPHEADLKRMTKGAVCGIGAQ